jgi:AraC-like DNA-binding protein
MPHTATKYRSGLIPTLVSTMLTPLERVRVDVASRGTYTALHRTSIDELFDDLRMQRSRAVLVSVSRYDSSTTARMAAMLREFPRVPTFALLTDVQRSTPHSALSLGQLGVRTLIDTRQPSGWARLRELLINEQATDVQRIALGLLANDLTDAPQDCVNFFEVLLMRRPHVTNVRQLARYLRVLPTTLLSRFYRVALPSPKRYIDVARLIRVAKLLENPGLSVSTVARQLDYSSPQAFSRHMRCVMRMSPVEFRRQYTSETMLQFFRTTLILPYRDTLRTFHPTGAYPSWATPV